MRFRREFVVTMCIALVAVASGCPGRAMVSQPTDPSNKGAAQTASAEDILKSAIHQLRPENFDIVAATDKPVSLLNSWRVLVADAKQNATDSAAPPIPSGWASDDEVKRVLQDKYDGGDAVHIRDCLLTHTIANYLAARSNNEVQRVRIVFDFVVRSVALRSENEPELPFGIYQILLLGHGSAEDRAWLCAALLRQLRIDSVIVRPSADAGAEANAWLLGVLLNERVYLFDPRLGVPLPTTADLAAADTRPATLDEIVAHPEWLQSLSLRADRPFAIDAESLKQPRLQPIVDANSWSRRISYLEQVLPAEDVCVLYDPLVDDLGRIGLLTRLASVIPGGKIEGLKSWPHSNPQRLINASKAMTADTVKDLQLTFASFDVPFSVKIDHETKQATQVVPERKQLRIRTDQLLGKFDDATQRYLSIRHLPFDPFDDKQNPPPPEILRLYRLAAEDAIYWSGLCKFEAEEYDAAIEQLNAYVKQFDRRGRWFFAARALLAECHAQQGRFAQAIAAVERPVPDDPYREATGVRIKRWAAQKDKSDGSSK